MNKYQEAFDWLMEVNNSSDTEWDLLQELVDRATPMEHIAELCPTCYESVHLLVTELNKVKQTLFYKVSYCCKCGQKIDWNGEDE